MSEQIVAVGQFPGSTKGVTSSFERRERSPKPSTRSSGAYVDLRVGPFQLALRAPHVVAVHADNSAAAQSIMRPDSRLPYVDLAQLFGVPGGQRAIGAGSTGSRFVLTLEGEVTVMRAAIGVDAIGHLHRVTPHPAPIPAHGVDHPELFEGAVRAEGRLLLVLAPVPLCRLVRTQRR